MPVRRSSVDTGTHERVADWSPDSVATVDPCDPGTDPKNGPSAGTPLRFNPDGVPELFMSPGFEMPEVVGARRRR